MKSIESRSNPLYKQLFKWQSSAGRRDEPILLEGVHLCEAFLALGRQPQYALFAQARIHEPQLVRLIDKLSEEVCCTLSGSLLGNLSNVDTDQGVLFVVKPSSPPLPEQLTGNMLWLDRVQDPGNVGTLLRTAAAAGIVRVLASTGTASLWSPKVLRSAQGVHFGLRLHEHVDLVAATRALTVPLIVTTLGDATDLFDTKLPPHAAWVFGHEGQGVSQSLIDLAALRLKVEHAPSVESLNITAAAAVCLFEQRRQQR
jgi:TrmH family RNA methyltransferase